MNNILYAEFKRKFSASMYKNLKVSLGEMTFLKDFITDTRGDLYPLLEKSSNLEESVENNCYKLNSGSVKRLFCQFFPYATYEITADITNGKIGFSFRLPGAEAVVLVDKTGVYYTCNENKNQVSLPKFVEEETTLVVSCRPGAFDVYFKNNDRAEFCCTFYEDLFKDCNLQTVFADSYVLVALEGKTVVKRVSSYIDNGVSIADIRPIKYENGDVIQENGKVFFTASIRMQEGTFQGMFSWVPGLSEFTMTGALFYDCGDGKWRNYVAPVILYNRIEKQWYVWVSSFEHEHVLAHSVFEGDPRYGVNVVDVKIMEKATEENDLFDFVGFKGDEDPDLIYDEKSGKWLLAICRLNPESKGYSYMFFEAENPFEGYKYIGKGPDGSETGGSFVKIDGELFFVCGNDPSVKSEYRIYSCDGVKKALFNYPDGGFRGWGSIIPVKTGSRTRYFWLTFDRHNGSGYNWSYGNIYCFEAM